MDRKLGSAATLLIAASVFYRGGTSDAGSKTSPDAGAETAPPISAKPALSSVEKGPWTPLCDYFAVAGDEAATQPKPKEQNEADETLARFCLDRPPATGSQRTVLLATIPDPELTHLSLSFDRYIESIAWALADGDLDGQRYSLSSYWFPWRPDAKEIVDPVQRRAAEEDRDKRVNTPGLLLFRGRGDPHKLLLVFLIGETPTSGINRIAFSKARSYAASLKTTELPICQGAPCSGILGPVFTGSLASLRLLLEEESSLPARPTFVVSGTITGAGRDSLPLKDTHFCSTIERGDNTRAAFLEYLKMRSLFGGDVSDQFAYLVEDETAYGETLETSPNPAPGKTPAGNSKPAVAETRQTGNNSLVLRYPRGIARIRNSSQELPGIGKAPSQTDPYPELPLNLRDTGQDSIPSFSLQQTPVSQEAVLIDLASTLRREHMKYVGIVATDPLDALFLSRVVRALDPDLRIVLFHADLLFERAARTWGLRGVLAVTSYPLISRTQYFAGARPPRRTQFASDSAEGEYNACRRMLLPGAAPGQSAPSGSDPLCDSAMPQAAGSPPGDYLLDYAAPFAEVPGHSIHRPSAWVTMLGHNSWWPVAALPAGSASALLNGPRPASHNGEKFSAEAAPQLWFLFFWILWAGCTAHVVLLFLMNLDPDRLRWLWKRAPLRVLGWGFRPELVARRRIILAIASLAVGSVCWGLTAAAYTSGVAAEKGNVQVFASILIGLSALAEAVWAASATRALWPVILAIASEVVIACAAARTGLTGHALAFAGYRAVHIESGTSPLVPAVLLLLALYLYCWFRLSQLRAVEDRSTPWPSAPELRLPVSNNYIARAKFDPSRFAAVVAGLLCWLVFFDPFRSFGAIEGSVYALVISLLSSAVMALLLLTAMRFFSAWGIIRKLLQSLERHPNRYAFTRLPKDFSWTAVWTGDSRPKLLMPMRSLDVLRMLPEGQSKIPAIEKELAALGDPSRSFSSSFSHTETLHKELNQAAGVVAAKLHPVWDAGISDSMASRPKSEEAPAEEDKDPLRAAREEYIALRYVAVIRYALLQMRAFLEFDTYGFILLVAALTAYPFDGHRKIGTALIVLFALIGALSVIVFAQMDRDPLLSRLSETKPNELDRNFFYRLLSFGALPLLTLLASQIPEVGNFLLSWAQPALEAMK